MSTLISLDVETTGTCVFDHQLLSISAVPVYADGGPLDLYVCPADTLNWTPWAKDNFKKFEDAWKRECQSPEVVYWNLRAWMGKYEDPMLLGHNIGFDLGFLKKLCRQAGHDLPCSYRTVDTHSLLVLLSDRGLLPQKATSSQGALDFFGIEVPEDERHTSLGDAKAVAELYRQISIG